MAKIVTLKDNNDAIVYPITPVDGVFVDSNTTLADALDDKADADFTNVAAGAITGGKIANNTITSSNIDLSTLGGNYSLSEVDTGYTWVDGKHIYKKTVNFGALPNNTAKNVAHGISGISYIIKIEGTAVASGAYYPLPLMYRGTDSNYNVQIWANDTNIQMTSNTDRSSYTAYVTLYYTKSS